MKKLVILFTLFVFSATIFSGCVLKRIRAPYGKEILLATEGESPKAVKTKRIAYWFLGLVPIFGFVDAFEDFKFLSYDVNTTSSISALNDVKKVRFVSKYDLIDYFLSVLTSLLISMSFASIDIEIIE